MEEIPQISGAQTIAQIINDDRKRKEKIFDIYTETKEKLFESESNSEILKNILKIEFDRMTVQLENNKKQLFRKDCPIVVAGETSAGKSCLINLLIGFDILPESFLPSTKIICRIYNSTSTREIRVTDQHDNVEIIPICSDEDVLKVKSVLKKYVTRKPVHASSKFVDVFLPVPMLQKDTTIVETPGIGFHQELLKRLFDYLPNAVAFIYVINSANGGGVENDTWLQKVIAELYKQQEDGKMMEFDHNTTIFVCNKWDQVPGDERKEVWEFILDKMKKTWPNFKEEQIFKLSTLMVNHKKQ